MLQYEFSKREKALIVVFVVILLALLWYRLIYVGTADQIGSLESQIEAVQTETEVSLTRAEQLNNMRATIEQQKAAGVQKAELPQYDNTTQLMQRLNDVLKDTANYTVSFDDVQNNQSIVIRGATINFGCKSMKKARSVIADLEQKTFACTANSVTMSINSSGSAGTQTAGASSGSGSSGSQASDEARVSVSLHANFYELQPTATAGSTPGLGENAEQAAA